MNTFRKLSFGPNPYDAPDVPVRFTSARSRSRAPKKGVQIVNNIARNQMLRNAGLEFLDLGKIDADRRKRLQGRPARMTRDELSNTFMEVMWEEGKHKREKSLLKRDRMMDRADLEFMDISKVRARGALQRDDINLFDDVVLEQTDDLELPMPEELAPVISLDAERARRKAVRRTVFSTRNAIATAAGALLGLMASGGAGVAYAVNQMDSASKAASVQMVKAPAASQMSESARVLAEIDEEAAPESEFVRTMDCSVPFEILEKKMIAWGGWEKTLLEASKSSKEGTVCDAHKGVQKRWGQKVADKFEYEAKHVPETSKLVEVTKEKKSPWSMAKRMASKAKKWFGGWA